MSKTIISLKNVHKKFQENSSYVHVLKGVNLDLQEGELVGLVGNSGTGKSTLLHLIGLLDSLTEGHLFIEGRDVGGVSDFQKTIWRQEKIGFVYQKHHLLSEYTVLENVMMPLLIQGESLSQAKELSFDLLERVGIAHRANFPINKISGGEQQRASVARALIKNPKILLADEPTGNLDQATGEQVFSLFLDLVKRRNITMLMVTHNPLLTEKMNRVLILDQGLVREKQ